MLLSIDSGANLGWALFDSQTKEMISCGFKDYLLALKGAKGANPIRRIIVERPHTGRGRARARDIITLAIRAGEVGGVLRHLTGINPEYIEPGKWKGQLKKELSNKIVEAKLSPRELSTLDKFKTKSTRHNVLDAIGIGLFIVGR